MKVLHIIDSGGLYGAEQVLLTLMVEQARQGIEPVLASIGEPGIDEKPIETEAMGHGMRVEKFRMSPGPNWFAAFSVLRFAKRERVDLLHSHGYKGDILLGFIPRKLLRKIPMLTTLHGWTSDDTWNRMKLYERLDALSFKFMDQVVLVSEGMKAHPALKKRIDGRFIVVENGISTWKLDKNSSPPLDRSVLGFIEGKTTIGAIGRLSREKGFNFLIEAFASLRSSHQDLRLVIMGEGTEREMLQDLIDRKGCSSHVLLPGFVSEAPKYLPRFSLFVMPSLTEGLPMVLLEAMMAGVPIVASRVGGIPRLLGHGRGGQLVNPGDVSDLIHGLRCIMRDKEGATKRVVWAGSEVRENYCSRVMADKYGEIYRVLLKKR